jgi:hypothetical protein
MTHPSKRKGNGFEREVVHALRRAGLAAERVPLSGQLPGYEGDVSVPVRGVERKLQCRLGGVRSRACTARLRGITRSSCAMTGALRLWCCRLRFSLRSLASSVAAVKTMR